MVLKRIEILETLFERLKQSTERDVQRGMLFGLPNGQSGIPGVVTAVALIRYVDETTIKFASRTLPYGMSVIGFVEFCGDEDQDLYAAVEHLDDPVIVNVENGKLRASTGLDFLTNVHLEVISTTNFWGRRVSTFHVEGKFLLYSQLEIPDLKDSFAQAKMRVLNQSAYTLGKHKRVTLLPRHGHVLTQNKKLKKSDLTAGELVSAAAKDEEAEETDGQTLVHVNIRFDQTKSNSLKKATLLISDTNPRCKLFEHYLPINFLVVVPNCLPAYCLYKKFNMAFLQQLEVGFHANILDQLLNSISADKPEPFHFWPGSLKHFVTVIYAEQTSEEKQKDVRLELHNMFYVKEIRPYFRRSAALFQKTAAVEAPHCLLPEKDGQVTVNGHYEYKHYMQDDFNDDGWGCAYRSLQTIVSWFRIQGFTSRPIPTHREIQECLVSLGDKPGSFVGSKQWIGSTEVSFVLEAMLGVSSRILFMSSGADMSSTSTTDALVQHFQTNGTPVMVGGGVYAHTIIGISFVEEEPSFLVLDPHYTGSDSSVKTILQKGWVGWKGRKFWSKTDFFNLCMPIPPHSI